MKKIILFLFILIGFCAQICYAFETTSFVKRPKWSEFCPVGFEHATDIEQKWFWPHGMRETQSLYNYWAKRKIDFENSLKDCDNVSYEFQSVCYSKLRSKEMICSEQYSLDMQRRMIIRQSWKDNHKTGSPVMIQILSR